MRVPGKESDFWLFPFGLSFLIARLFDKYVRRWASRTRTRFGKTLVDALLGPRPIFLPLLGGPDPPRRGRADAAKRIDFFASSYKRKYMIE